ncbi:MarR family winged helix-turn-helix transcriptional regulator [Chloroflexota bacterium]
MTEDYDFLLWLLLNRTHYIVDRARQKELHQYGISPRAAGVLFTILKSGNSISQTKLVKELNLEPHSISELLSRMSKQGLVVKVKDLEKRNLVRVEVTEKGLEVFRLSTNRKSIIDIMSVLTREEKEQLWEILSKIRESALDQRQQDKSNLFPPSDLNDM